MGVIIVPDVRMSDLISKNFGIPIINTNRRYWFVRTNGGKYYDDFILGGFVAIGYNFLTEKIIEESYKNNNKDLFLRGYVEKLYPKESRPGLIIGYINKFYQDIKKGDIVISPSIDSDKLSFGEIIDEKVYYESEESIKKQKESIEPGTREICEYQKRRKVHWTKAVEKNNIDLKLFRALCSHTAISDISNYDNAIERSMNNLYIKGDLLHYRFDITAESNIGFKTYLNLYSAIDDVVNEFNNFDEPIKASVNNITIKTQAESPGFIEFISEIPKWLKQNSIPTCLVIGMALTFIFGGSFKLPGISFETKGLPDFLIKMTKWHQMIDRQKLDSVSKLKSAVRELQPHTDADTCTRTKSKNKKHKKSSRE
jgi:hypothetical protein